MNQVDILAIFAHPDDAELTVGGTMLKMKHLGYRTGALDVTAGEMGTRGTQEGRAIEAAEAARILKLDLRENLGLPDGHVFVTDFERTALVRALRRLKPKVILTHQIGDSHPDHDHIAQLVRESARLASMRRYDEEIYVYRCDMHSNDFCNKIISTGFIRYANTWYVDVASLY